MCWILSLGFAADQNLRIKFGEKESTRKTKIPKKRKKYTMKKTKLVKIMIF